MAMMLMAGSGGSGGKYSGTNAAGERRATTSQVLHNTTVWTILAVIGALMVGTVVGLWAYIVYKDKHWKSGAKKALGTYIEIILSVVVAIVLILLLGAAIFVVWEFPGPGLAEASIREKRKQRIDTLEGIVRQGAQIKLTQEKQFASQQMKEM